MDLPDPSELIEFLAPYSPEVRELALLARQQLHEIAGPASDLFFDATQAVCAGLSYTGLPKDNFINIAVYAKHVTLIFPFGARLIDPERRLKGEGSTVRNIRLQGIETLRDDYVVGLIQQCMNLAVRPESPINPVKYVKIYQGPKKRPS